MQPTKDHIGLETAKLLKDCGVESKYYFIKIEPFTMDAQWIDDLCSKDIIKEINPIEKAPAYTWGEILWEHAEKFFGKSRIEQSTEVLPGDYNKKHIFNKKDFYTFFSPAYTDRAKQIIVFLQQKKYKEADLFFRKHCILIKK